MEADRTTALLDQLVEHPHEREGYAVYGDALQAAGDPQGELVALSLRLEEQPRDGRARAAARELQRSAEELIVPADDRWARASWRWRRGFVVEVTLAVMHYGQLAHLLPRLFASPYALLLSELRLMLRDEELSWSGGAPAGGDLLPAEIREIVETQRPPLLGEPMVGYLVHDLAAARAYPEETMALRCVERVDEDPSALAALLALPNLEELDLMAPLTRIPAELGQLQRLRELTVGGGARPPGIPSEVLALPRLAFVDLMGCHLPKTYHRGRIADLVASFGEQELGAAERRVQIDLLLDRPLAEGVGLGELLAALDARSSLVRRRALEALEELLPEGGALVPVPYGASRVALAGELRSGRKVLRSKLEERGVKVLSRPARNMTHLLLGERCAAAACAATADVTFLLEGPLLRALGAADAASPKERRLTREALESRDEGRVREALVSLAGDHQRASEHLLEILLVAQDTLMKEALRGRAKKLFSFIAPEAVKRAAAVHLKLPLTAFDMGDGLRARRIEAFCSESGLCDAEVLAAALFRRCGLGFAALAGRVRGEPLRQLLQGRVRDGCLRLWRLDLQELPPELARVEGVRHLDLRHNRLRSLQEPLLAHRALETLDLAQNPLQSVPEQLAELSGLRRVDLSGCGIQRFPRVLTQLTELRELSLMSGSVISREVLRELPGDLDALQDLEVLRLAGGAFERFPAALWELGELRLLDLRQARLPEELPRELTRLTKLEELWVSHSSWAEEMDALQELLPNVQIG